MVLGGWKLAAQLTNVEPNGQESHVNHGPTSSYIPFQIHERSPLSCCSLFVLVVVSVNYSGSMLQVEAKTDRGV